MSRTLPLHGKTALVTGVSRRRGIGFAVASKLASLGASVVIHHHRPHDLDLPWGGDDLDAVRDGVRAHLTEGARFADFAADLSDASTIPGLIADAAALTGTLDVLVCNHAKSGDDGSILDMTPERLSAFWEVNTRATVLLTAEFARLRAPRPDEPRRPGDRIQGNGPYPGPQGHVFWMTSGQIHGAMRGEVAYAASKAALAGVTATVAQELLELGIVLNTINPGPVNTGYLDPETTDRSLDDLDDWIATTPFGRVGRPEDPAELIAWLATSAGSWVVGQVLTSDGGFSL
ncbi:SDR family oxidoreductase [Curtobacterium sp. B18]|uniref:SDR family oxidoreductase n=1 Tax=Curtobacterium sp. B18 TaxID=95614 RepID=UPI00034BC0D0|nr:SDR family oxidoreductase [Curtobacterium sp. B18]